jgi:hypothetical protein
MNGRRAESRTKACKMAFFRTAGGAVRASAGEGAHGCLRPCSTAAQQKQKPATWRALGPLGPHGARSTAASADPSVHGSRLAWTAGGF